MPRLIIMRHAQAKSGSDDFQRPLTAAGRDQARSVGRKIADAGWHPELVVSSSARRTRETWDEMEDVLGGAITVAWLESFYGGGVQEISGEFHGLEEDIDTLMVLGHNPGWQQAVAFFSGEQTPIGTGFACLLETETSWPEATGAGDWSLVRVIEPER